jgi:hypothetical protein
LILQFISYLWQVKQLGKWQAKAEQAQQRCQPSHDFGPSKHINIDPT